MCETRNEGKQGEVEGKKGEVGVSGLERECYEGDVGTTVGNASKEPSVNLGEIKGSAVSGEAKKPRWKKLAREGRGEASDIVSNNIAVKRKGPVNDKEELRLEGIEVEGKKAKSNETEISVREGFLPCRKQ